MPVRKGLYLSSSSNPNDQPLVGFLTRQIVGQYGGTRRGPMKPKMYVYYIAAGGVSQPEKRGMRHGDGGRSVD